MLYHQNPEIGQKLKLVLEMYEEVLVLGKVYLQRRKKELKNIDIRWSIQDQISTNPDGYSTSSNQDVSGNSNAVFSGGIFIYFQSLHLGMAKPVPICNVFDFDSLCMNRTYIYKIPLTLSIFSNFYY